ncbi:MAG: hypothetical protein NPIRA02_29370 [Nitrospirales bacterium]|nr:MAG: hypothetical protein NPIRA02_29370 [Nitrospirales bacterium]
MGYPKLDKLLNSTKISSEMHERIKSLSKQHNRKISDEIRELLRIGINCVEGNEKYDGLSNTDALQLIRREWKEIREFVSNPRVKELLESQENSKDTKERKVNRAS